MRIDAIGTLIFRIFTAGMRICPASRTWIDLTQSSFFCSSFLVWVSALIWRLSLAGNGGKRVEQRRKRHLIFTGDAVQGTLINLHGAPVGKAFLRDFLKRKDQVGSTVRQAIPKGTGRKTNSCLQDTAVPDTSKTPEIRIDGTQNVPNGAIVATSASPRRNTVVKRTHSFQHFSLL